VVLEVADDTVVVRKEVAGDRSIVTMTTPTDRLILTVRRGRLSVNAPGVAVSMDVAGGRNYDRLLDVLRQSEAGVRARVLLAQVTEGPGTFVGQSLLLTRAILEAGGDSPGALRQHQQWASERAAASVAARSRLVTGGPRRVLASVGGAVQDRGPGDCWDIYAEEAIEIAHDFSECTDDAEWYEAHKWVGCSLVYTVRAEGAMAWYIACNGGAPFRG
jgi:hypothetical protein